jgi:hypothetical protein
MRHYLHDQGSSMKGHSMKRILAVVPLLLSPLLLAPPAQAEECDQYMFPSLVVINQSNGYRIEFSGDGGPLKNVVTGERVTAFNNQQAVANTGAVSGNIDNRAVFLTVTWDNGTVGQYTGSVDNKRIARGQTSGGGGSANWNMRSRVPCLT